MSKVVTMRPMDLDLCLTADSNEPLYRQLCNALKAMIDSGQLQPGQFLPSTRELAESLGIARISVVRCYEELASQGYLEAAIGKGTFVSQKLYPGSLGETVSPPGTESDRKFRSSMLSNHARWLLQSKYLDDSLFELADPDFATTPSDLLPINTWRKLFMAHCRAHDMSLLYQADVFGYPPLREAIATYLRKSRGIDCQKEQIILFDGTQPALHTIGRILLDPDDEVAVENPGFPLARHAFLSLGARLHPIAVDEHGMDVDELTNKKELAKVVYVTPPHQDPTGAQLSMKRRRQLLDWAYETGSIIIEDDHDGEYCYGAPVLPALKSMDNADSVIYPANFWRVLHPLVSISYLVVPPSLIEAYTRAQRVSMRVATVLEQCALTDFINEGYLARYVKGMRNKLAKRRRSLVDALKESFGQAVTIEKTGGGTYLLIHLNTKLADQEVLQFAQQSNVYMVSTRPCYMDREPHGEFVVSFAHMKEDSVKDRIKRLAKAINSGSSVLKVRNG